MNYKAEKKTQRKKGVASLGWHLGHGYVNKKLTIKFDGWCVTDGSGCVIASTRGEKAAKMIADALNSNVC